MVIVQLFRKLIMTRWKQNFLILLILAITFTLIGPVAAQPVDNSARIQPYLLDIATTAPDQIISVIVQRNPGSSELEKRVVQLGGKITQDLAIIDSFVAEMPAGSAYKIAKDPGVRWVSLDSPLVASRCKDCVDTSSLVNTYVQSVRADQVWNQKPLLQGQGIGVAVIDSGINYSPDFYTRKGLNRVVAAVSFQEGYNQSTFDAYGHGTHIAGIVGGNGDSSGGKYIGVAPLVNLINVKVCDDLQNGLCTSQSIVNGLQWALEHKDQYNIRVVNISLNSTIPESYNTSPINAAVELLWFNGIVVVVSAGNHGVSNLFAPANDPYVIVVGAVDEQDSVELSDDEVAGFSASGITVDGFAKPDLVAPGKNIVSLMGLVLPVEHPENIVDHGYFMMTGTSVASPIVAGGAALLLQDEPNLTPDQVKYRLMATANKDWPEYSAEKAGAGYLDVYAAVHGNTTESANQDFIPHQLLARMAVIAFWANQNGGDEIDWENVDWEAVNWDNVNWDSVNWSSVNWSSVNWSSVNWSSVNWSSVNWSSVNWSSVNWSSANWSNVNWNSDAWIK
jgi:serine protease AprX